MGVFRFYLFFCDAPRESTVRGSIDFHGGDCMARRPKLTQEMVDEAIRLKADGLSNGDIICALGIHESTFYRWIGDPKNKLQREGSSPHARGTHLKSSTNTSTVSNLPLLSIEFKKGF